MAKRDSYYLRINGKYIVFFDTDTFSSDMTDYLQLNLFTSSFSTFDELVNALRIIGVISAEDVRLIDIVKMETTNDGHRYIPLNTPILLNEARRYLNEKVVRDFFYYNRNNHEVIRYLLKKCKERNDKILGGMALIKNNAFKDYVASKIYDIDYLFALLRSMDSGMYVRQEDYDVLLDTFVKRELHVLGRDAVDNRALIDLAAIISDCLRKFGCYTPPLVESELDKKLSLPHSMASDKHSVDGEDPDRYMFLEREDYVNEERLSSNPRPEEQDRLMEDYERIEKKQKGIGK